MRITNVALAALLVAAVGCHKEITRENPQADTHVDLKPGLFEVNDSANKFKEKLANFRFPDDAIQKYGTPMPVALLPFKNDTHEHFDTKLFTDAMRDILQETGKVAFQIEADRVGDAAAQDAYEKNFNSTDPNQQITENQAAGTRYVCFGRIASIVKTNAADGVSENTYVITMEFIDKQRKLNAFPPYRAQYRLRKE
jgi:hypothetical protein